MSGLPGFASRLSGLPAAATIEMARRARALAAQGHDVISLALGEPDFASPDIAVEAAYEAARAGQTKYPPVDGTPVLKKAVADKFRRENRLEYAQDEIIVCNGGKQVIFNAFMATVDPGDEVVVPAPYWVSYPLIARMFGGVPVYAACREEDGFRLTAAALEAVLTERSVWLVLNFPNNPTGAVCSEEDYHAIAAVVRRFPKLRILSDEIYEHLTFDGKKHVSFAAVVPDLKYRILTLNGMAKAYAMTGWRVGFAGGHRDLITAMRAVQSNATSGICTLAQAGAAAALNADLAESVLEMRETYARRRSLVADALRRLPGVSCALPDGAFYVYPGIAGCLGKTSAGGRRLESDRDFAFALLEEAHVATVPGEAFGLSPYLRLSCATSDEMLREACARIGRFVSGLS
ncbi:pyridoxal phosphate-dependent aminotransferase [Acetobacter sp. AN02]|uniref:pyridoxal phosphate-dependent aminotransferase n=1 Tax=Acetobacter sp. AN02 TaxID=2894186 RepID=UPI0024344489|nr:pyridoxal phosphate-dependent aminotransferase [Acetobacter sp. AN02]MDG6094877.1 pyridoxal phosphate-dependent aminotransferase [Acetobacter sp. AN02]